MDRNEVVRLILEQVMGRIWVRPSGIKSIETSEDGTHRDVKIEDDVAGG